MNLYELVMVVFAWMRIREAEKQDGGYMQCISVQTLIFRQVVNLYVQGHLYLLSGVAPSYSSKESALHCY